MLWDLFQDLRELQGEIDHLFKLPALMPDLYYSINKSKNPPMNLREDHNNLYLDVLLPGVNKENLQINFKDNTLNLSGQKSSPANVSTEDYHRRERTTGNFLRSVKLPMDINPEMITANYENGILIITLPKSERAKPKIIQVKAK